MKHFFRTGICFFCLLLGLVVTAYSQTREYYEIRIYHFSSNDQERILNNYLKDSYLPALKRAGIKSIGVFKPITNDTASEKKIFLLIPVKSVDQALSTYQKLDKDQRYQESGKEYLQMSHTAPPFKRIESIFLKAFKMSPKHKQTSLTNNKSERIYELRSYEGHTEMISRNKISMFNDGEIQLFERLGFNAIFYAEVIYGCRIPNLMYMTSFSDMKSRNDHWKTFGSDPEWKKMAALPQFQNNVSRIDTYLLTAMDYSDF